MVCSAVGFLEGGVFVQHVAHHRNVIALVLKKTGDGAAQTLMRDIVGGMGGDRQIAACQLVRTTAFKALKVSNRKLDTAIHTASTSSIPATINAFQRV